MSMYGHNPTFGQTGERTLNANGDFAGPRIERSGALVTQPGGASLQEIARQGKLFGYTTVNLTLGAGNLVGHTAAAATNTALFNPVGSGVDLVIHRIGINVDSGTFAAGGAFVGVMANHTIASSLANSNTGTNLKVGGAVSRAEVQDAGTAAALTGGQTSTQVECFAGTTATASANGYLHRVVAELDGSIVCPPGTAVLPLFEGAGTTVIFSCSYIWSELTV